LVFSDIKNNFFKIKKILYKIITTILINTAAARKWVRWHMARNWKLMDFECIWNIYSQPILKGIVLIMVGAVQSLFSFFMRLPLDLVHSFLYNLCPMHADVKYLITAWWVMMSWDLAIWIGGVRVISSKFLARNSFNSRGMFVSAK